MEKLKIGVVGVGSIGRYHIESYQKLDSVKVVAVSDVNAEKAGYIARQYGIERTYGEYEEMFEKAKPDGISICTWTSTHKACAIAAMEAGIDVLCEKPLAVNAAEAKEMEDAAEATGRLLMVGFSRRFTHNALLMRQFIEEGRMGDIYYAKTGCMRRFSNPGGWFSDSGRSGGGPLIDSGVHIVDLVRYLMGNPRATSVYGRAYRDTIGARPGVKGGLEWFRTSDYTDQFKNDVEDGAIAIINFDNNASVFLETSWVQNIQEEKMLYCEIYGTKAGATVEPDVTIMGELCGYMVDTKPLINPSDNTFASNFDRELAHFTDCLLHGDACMSPVADGVEVMRILDAIYLSAAKGEIVRLS
jgi:predicted dehydrogenase